MGCRTSPVAAARLCPSRGETIPRRKSEARPPLTPEDMMRHLAVGDIHGCFKALTTLAAFVPFRLGDRGQLADVPDPHWDFLERQTRTYHETATHFFVHANAYPDYPLAEQPESVLLWEFFDNPPPHESGKVMVCGHTPQKSGRPKSV